jgi:hypothetical protein
MKLISRFITFISLTLFITPLFAHGPTPQKVDESIVIQADVAKVWKKIQAFDLIANWHPEVTEVKMEDDTTRVLTLKNGGNITDSLDEVNEEEQYVSYRLLAENPAVFPVSFYTITIQVASESDASKVSWSGRFYRGDTGNFPSDELNDQAAINAMTSYATSGLAGLKKALED